MQRRQALRRLAVLGGVGLAGCTGGDGGDTPGDGGPIKVGLLTPLRQPGGKEMKQALNYYTEQSDLDYDVTVKDTKFSVQKTKQATRSLLNSKDVDLLVGGYLPNTSLAAQKMIAGDGPLFLNIAITSNLPAQRLKQNYDEYKYWFGGGLTSAEYAKDYSNFFTDIIGEQTGIKSFGMLLEKVGTIPQLGKTVKQSLTDAGFTHEKSIQYPADTKDLRPSLSTMEDAGVDAVLPVATVTAPIMYKQWNQTKKNYQLIAGTSQVASDSWPKSVGSDVANTTSMSVLTVKAPITDLTVDWWDQWVQDTGEDPFLQAGRTVGMMDSYEKALGNVGNKSAYDELVTELEKNRVKTVFGHMDYKGKDAAEPHFAKYNSTDALNKTWFQWQQSDGELQKKLLHPSDWADSDGEQEFQLADWVTV